MRVVPSGVVGGRNHGPAPVPLRGVPGRGLRRLVLYNRVEGVIDGASMLLVA